MPWIRRNLRGNVVFVRVDESAAPITNARGLAEVVYKLAPNAKIYNAAVKNLEKTGNAEDEKPFESDQSPSSSQEPAGNGQGSGNSGEIPPDAIIIYTDGACTGNPGPMGIGAVVLDGDKRHEISEFIGQGTNNIAELTAIERALDSIPESQRSRPVIVHSDSSYSIGLLDKGWKAKANVALVQRIRELTARFPALSFVKVRGHSGVPENERCDQLAVSAIESR